MQFQSDESAFNFGFEYLKQVSESLRMCSIYAVNEDVDNWCKWLRNLYRQLSIKLKDDEDIAFTGDYEIPVDLNKLTGTSIKDSEANFRNIYFLMKPEYRQRYKSIILFLLDRLDVKLRRKWQEKGALLPSKNDPRYAILER